MGLNKSAGFAHYVLIVGRMRFETTAEMMVDAQTLSDSKSIVDDSYQKMYAIGPMLPVSIRFQGQNP